MLRCQCGHSRFLTDASHLFGMTEINGAARRWKNRALDVVVQDDDFEIWDAAEDWIVG